MRELVGKAFLLSKVQKLLIVAVFVYRGEIDLFLLLWDDSYYE